MDGFYSKKIESFQALRGVAALFIIMEHTRFLACGAFGVDIFFILSGFMAVYTTSKDMKNFLMKRVIRVVPFYWIMTVGTFLGVRLVPQMFENTRSDLKSFLFSMFCIPFDMNSGAAFYESSDSVIQPLMRIGWTLELELLFYVIFYLAGLISHRFRALISTGFLAVLCAVAVFVKVPAFMFWGNPVVLEFSLGMLLCYICKALYEKEISKQISNVCMIIVPVLLAALAVTKKYLYFNDFRRLFVWGLPAFFVVLCTYVYGQNRKAPGALAWFGDISFSVYWVHYYIVMSFDRLWFDFSAPTLKAWVGFTLAVVATIIAAVVCNMLIEKRLTKTLRNIAIR